MPSCGKAVGSLRIHIRKTCARLSTYAHDGRQITLAFVDNPLFFSALFPRSSTTLPTPPIPHHASSRAILFPIIHNAYYYSPREKL